MKISLLQTRIALGDFTANKYAVTNLLQTAMRESPDVIVLPEMWNIGFFPRPLNEYADDHGQQVRTFLSGLAEKYSVNIVGGSAAVQKNGNFFNTAYIFDRLGNNIAEYSKIHLFSPTKEDKFFQHGSQLATFELDDVKCGIALCYDIRFPEQIRRLALQKIDILFLPAAWPVERLTHWQILNTARAIENQIFVAAANGVGTFNKFQLGGSSLLIDPWGQILNQADDSETIVSANFKLAVLQDIRAHMNIMQDRQPLDEIIPANLKKRTD